MAKKASAKKASAKKVKPEEPGEEKNNEVVVVKKAPKKKMSFADEYRHNHYHGQINYMDRKAKGTLDSQKKEEN